ncbi:hypothetical protein [Anabaena azotica]|uniref:Uncharacterized protein n=1 Tax=Anabaena azotica FACHB-119 TaxID=947527 RepID=A0ABR8DEA5_9NOST|nr:hypothetical protein [Anabaena azotica]MBD2505291.1 hypothetical protein [Anabaena azotica FACHB-119]
MTHPRYSHQSLERKSIARLKQIYSEIGGTTVVRDRRRKNAWISAIAQHQTRHLYKIAPAALDQQAQAQAELENFIAQQAEEIAPESLTVREISFYETEYYAGDKLIATVSYDSEDFVTLRWVVMVNGQEIHRDYTLEKCVCRRRCRRHRFINWKYLDGSLPVQEQNATQTDNIGNEIMTEVAAECEKRGLELIGVGVRAAFRRKARRRHRIYRDGNKLGEVELSQGILWAVRADNRERVMCECGTDAFWWLSTANPSFADEYLQYYPLEQLKPDQWGQLFVVA